MADPSPTSRTNAPSQTADAPDREDSRARPEAGGAARRPRRRWLRRIGIGLGILVLLLAILIALAPSLISTQAGVNYLESMVNANLTGAVELGELSLGWGGPTEVRSVRVLDPQKREVLKVEKVTVPAGVWGLVTDGLNFGEVVIDAPHVDLYVNEANEVSLAKALQPKTPSPNAEAGPLPEPRGKIVLRRGTVRAVRDGGAAYELTDVDAQLDLDTLNAVTGKLALKLADGVPLTADVDLKELIRDGEFQLDAASGKLSVQTAGPASVAPLAAFAAPDNKLTGTIKLDGQATLVRGDIAAEFAVVVAKLQTPERAAAQAAPLDLELRGRGDRKGDALTAQAELTGAAGQARADLTYRASDAAPAIKTDDVLSAILTGAPLALPEFGLDVEGSIDLAKLQQAVPGIFDVREGLSLTGGKLEIAKVSARGGSNPTAAGSISLSGITATGDGKTIQLEPISLNFDAALASGKGLQIGLAELKASFAELSAKGAASDLRASFRGDLAKAHRELGQVFDLTGLDLAGDVSGDLQVARASDERIDVALTTTGSGLRLGRDAAQFDVQKLTVQHSGFLTLANDEVTRFDIHKAEVDLDSQVTAAATGWYDFNAQGFHAALDLKRADLAFAAARADALEMPALKRYSGTLTAQVAADRSAAASPIKTAGSLTASGITVDGDAALDGDAVLTWSGVSVAESDASAESVKLASSAASIDLTGLRWKAASGDSSPVTADQVLSAVLNGTPLALPDFAIDVAGGADLPRLQKLFPDLIQVRPGQQLTGGKLTIANVSARGGSEPVVAGKLELTDVAASDGGKAIQIAPIALVFEAALKKGAGLQIAKTELTSSFAELNAKGAASDLQATFRANLAKLRQELSQVFDVGQLELAGEVDGTIKLARASDERVNVLLKANANGVKAGDGSSAFDLQRATLQQTGFVTLQGQSLGKFEITESGVDLDGQVAASATGWYDFQQQGFSAAIDIKRADLGFAASRAAALGVEDLKRYSGAIVGKTVAQRSAAGQPITSSGGLTTQGLSVDAKPLLGGDAKLDWAGLALAADGQGLTVESLTLDSSAAKLNAKSVRWQSGESMELSADVDASADLRPCLDAVALVARLDQPPAIAGKFSLASHVSTSSDVVTIKGKGGIDQFEVGAGEQTLREPRVDFELDAQLDQPNERLALGQCTLKSAPLTAEVSGSVDQYKTTKVLALKGRYDAGWDQVTKLLHEFVPTTAQTVVVKGKSASQFEIAGPLNAPGATSAFRNLTGGTEIGWPSADVYGLALGAGKLAPALRDGQFTLPMATIPTTDGKVNVGSTIDFTPSEPTLKIPGRLQVLDRVAITPQLGQSLLSRINPIFMHVTRIEGRASLHTQDVLLPLGESIKRTGNGAGQLDLASVKMQPAGLLGQLVALAGASTGTDYAVQFGRCDFQISEGRIRYDNFSMTFPENFDLIFRGSVGFDETLDLIVSVPVRASLLEKLGVSGSAALFARQLDGVRVDIPITGTRDKPVLETAKVNTENLLKGLLKPGQPDEGLEKGLGDLLKGLGGKKDKPKKNP